jgi:hypothetical protein
MSFMTAPVLAYYDVNLPLTIQCDASSTDLGAALIQDGKPVAYASRALTAAKGRYAQIEKETFAVTFACLCFNQYTYAKNVTVGSVHKPLEVIFKKSLIKAPKRLQRMMLFLQNYNVSIKFVKGTEMYLADTLSRTFITNGQVFLKETKIDKFQFLKITDEV